METFLLCSSGNFHQEKFYSVFVHNKNIYKKLQEGWLCVREAENAVLILTVDASIDPPNQTAYLCMWCVMTCTSMGFGCKQRQFILSILNNNNNNNLWLFSFFFTFNLPPLSSSLIFSRASTVLLRSLCRRRPKSLNMVEPPESTTFCGIIRIECKLAQTDAQMNCCMRRRIRFDSVPCTVDVWHQWGSSEWLHPPPPRLAGWNLGWQTAQKQ